jgi:hypothetical protein
VAETGANRYASADVSMGRQDIEDVRLEIAPVFDLGATVDWPEASAKTNQIVKVTMIGDDPSHQVHPATQQPDGTLHVAELRAGRYRVFAAAASASLYVSAVLLGSGDITGQLVDITPVSPPLHIVLKPNAGGVRGTVNQGGSSFVALIPQTYAAGAGAEFVRLVKCSPDGTFEIGGLPPGSYNALALENAPDATALLSLSTQASSVRVEEGATATLELRLAR